MNKKKKGIIQNLISEIKTKTKGSQKDKYLYGKKIFFNTIFEINFIYFTGMVAFSSMNYIKLNTTE